MIDIAHHIQRISIIAVPLLLALCVHEVAHGLVALRLGDPTARQAGRLTLNPLKHLDPIGTIAFFFVSIGWGKPVPVDARYFKNPRKGMMLVALAGPASNFLLASLFAVGFHLIQGTHVSDPDGLVMQVLYPLLLICQAGVFVNLILGVFNLLPIPPLDGSSILAYFLPARLAYQYERLGRYGFFIVIGLVLLGNLTGFSVLGALLFPPVEFLGGLLNVPI
ncbi:site-2 protease family protein [Pseudodesulfovibrio senegalensis]|jgi:Zn-dependent protease|uniref:Site-2 protease family protein n=1 Tax=Pseudodesulfovibrio senegalensis TaxID=1721087 RepID=A0A6N6N5C3_9BACT|nr:site-2 protease family protein [Pseudodesulfovibrio senegalensis]KAB1442086.1 site-2 protease family protein [Pseudodesulfovibrio senegalensis]